MVTCCVIGCNNRCTNIEKNSAEKITFHKIPKDEKRRKEWIRAVCRKDWEASARSAICSVHFRQEDIDRSSLVCVRLREGVIPSVFPTFPTYYQQSVVQKGSAVVKKEETEPAVVKEDEIVCTEDFLEVSLDIDGNQTKLRDSTDVTGIKVEAVEIEDTHVDNLYPSGLEFVSCGVENSEEFKGEQCLARSIKSEESIVLRDNADIQGHNSCDSLQSGVVSGSVQSNSLSAADSSYTYSDDRKFTCNVCAEVFTQSEHLKHHKLIHDSGKEYQCDICNKCFSLPRKLRQHKAIHSDKEYQCDVCNKVFTLLRTLKQHKLIHSGIKQFMCDICNKGFSQSSNLKQHKFIHSGVKKYQCDVCSKVFRQGSHLSTHKTIHTGEKKHQCEICFKVFRVAGSLKMHKFTHIDVKSHSCDICNKTFSLVSALRIHKLTHDGTRKNKCDICSKSYYTSNALKRHKSTHDDIKKYHCDVCNKLFSHSYTLKQHKLTHSDVIPYKCDICNKGCYQRSNLNKHMLMHSVKK